MSTSVSAQSVNPTRQKLDELDALLKRMLDLPVNQVEEANAAVSAAAKIAPSIAPVSAEPPPRVVAKESPAAPVEPPPEQEQTLSFTVVETASPRTLPPASGFEPTPLSLAPRLAPVSPEESPPEPAAPEPAATEPSSDPASAEQEVWVPLCSTWQPSAQTWPPLADSWQQATAAAAAAEDAPRPEVKAEPEVAVVPMPEPRPLPTPPGPRVETKVFAPPPVRPTPPAPPPPAESSPSPLTLSAEDAPVRIHPLLLPLLWFNQGFDACLAPLGAPGRWLTGPGGRRILGTLGVLCLAGAAALAVTAGIGWKW
jgi:hypothetical protein